MQPIKNIIFDLGGVLLDIDFKRTFTAFEKLGVPDFESLYSQHSANPFFKDFEQGRVPVPDFLARLREICGCPLTDDQIRDAWDALLISFPPERVSWLLEIRKKYRVFLFSNTNIIHYEWFAKAFYEQTGMDFNSVFVKAYYSHEMGLRKPDPASYQYIINEQQLNPAETLFIDDTISNIEAAEKLGLQVIHLVKPVTVVDLGL